MKKLIREIVNKLNYYSELDRRKYLAAIRRLDQKLYQEVISEFIAMQQRETDATTSLPTSLDLPQQDSS